MEHGPAGSESSDIVETQRLVRPEGYGTFEGVFVPTLLTILGVIMYLRAGWVIGNAGLAGGLFVIVLAFAITGATGLALSSIVTNIRIGAGGAYSVISKSLGLEVGGAIGIPLFLAQTLAVALYVFGFRAGWLTIFPDHPAVVVDLVIFAAILVISLISAGLAFRVQYVILGVIVASLVSVAVAAAQGSMTESVTLFGDYRGEPPSFDGTNFWFVFAVFFPAATGILAGANISGELRDPRRSIPVGTLGAIGLSLGIYILLAYWLARSATPEELTSNYTILVDKAAWGPAVLAGLLGATFSSGLASLVGAPRILQALAVDRVVPRSGVLSRLSGSGEPRNATYLAGVIVLAALMLRDLNAIAPLITMFFLITYLMINVVVLIEQRLGLVSFRPLFRVPGWVPAIGAGGCLLAMFVVNAVLGLLAVMAVLAFYGYLVRRRLEAPFGDVRSGLFVALSEWAANRVQAMSGTEERAWKPNLLAPARDADELRGVFRFMHAIAAPHGTVRAIGLSESPDQEFETQLSDLALDFREEGVFASWSVLEASGLEDGVVASMQALRGGSFEPNIAFLRLPDDPDTDATVARIADRACGSRLGLLLYGLHPKAGLGRRQRINVVMDDRSPGWGIGRDLGDHDLAVLVGFKLVRNWDADLTLLSVVADSEQAEAARDYLERVVGLARLPAQSRVVVAEGTLAQAASRFPTADLNVLALDRDPDLELAREIVRLSGASCLFALDSGNENALA
ncbi:MAG: amino acid permease [Solirubrobacterales bacterium]